ncbi:helix-turn-helix domain-containing protein [Lutispora sp.]|uniref:helix-turn-helix domain-containing protein n=1 Tax=Lutispora sp. TaxID=2828727 RepID=UPI003564498F
MGSDFMLVSLDRLTHLTGAVPMDNIQNAKLVIENFCTDDIAIVTTNKSTNICHGTHFHDSYEFVICHTRVPSAVIDDKIYDRPMNALFAVNPMQDHGLAIDVKGSGLCGVHIDRETVESVAYEIYGSPHIVFSNETFKVNHDIKLLANLLLEELKYKQAGHEFMVENLAHLIIGSLMRNINHNLPSRPHNKPGGYKENIKKVIDYMNENYTTSVSCTELSKLIKMDKYRFIRTFKSQTHKTPYEYLLDLKIEKAKKMLKAKDYTITEISMICGFSSHSHFTSTFKKKTGLSPSEYRMDL